jgi:hypothetical protein
MYELISKAFEQKKSRKYDKLFWAIDLHDTVITGKYNKFNEGAEIYPCAAEVLNYLYSRSDMCLILWTSSHKEALDKTLPMLEAWAGIKFHYLNENPEVPSTELCDFKSKFYFNILLDDKAGFNGNQDWITIKKTLKSIGEWKSSGKYKIEHSSYIDDIWIVYDAQDAEKVVVFSTLRSKDEALQWIACKGGVYVP